MKQVLLSITILLVSNLLLAQPSSSKLVDKIILNSPLLYNDADSGLTVANQWLSQSKKEKDVMAQVRTMILISNLLSYKGEKSKAENKMLETLDFTRKQENKEALEFVLISKASHYFSLQNGIKGVEDFDEIIRLSKPTIHKSFAIEYYQYFANYNIHKVDTAIYYLQLALKEAKIQKNQDKISAIYTNIGRIIGNRQAKYDEAITYLDSAKFICSKFNYLKTLGNVHSLLSTYHHKKNNYDEALQEINFALPIQQRINDPSIILAKSSQANIFASLDKYEDAIRYYKEAVSLGKKFNEFYRIPSIIQNIGSTYARINQLDSAKHYYLKGKAMAEQLNDRHGYAYATYNYADLMKNEGNYTEAKKGMLEALKIFEQLEETSNIAWVLPRIVELELIQYEHKNNNTTTYSLKELENFLDRSISLNANGNNYETLENIYDCYARLGKLTGNSNMTMNYQRKLLILKDTIFNQERVKADIEMAAKLNDAEQKATIAQLEIKSNKEAYQKRLALIMLGLFILTSIGLYFNYRNRMRRKNELALLKQKEEFRNQISSDLHDDVGTLLTGVSLQSELASMSATENLKASLLEISCMSKAAMEQMRDIVWALDSRKDKYENLIDRMRAFSEQQLHLKNINHKFTFNLKNGGQTIAPNVRQNVYLIFKEAITNIVKHSNADFVEINFEQNDNQSKLSVKDNGTKTNTTATDGSGLANMKRRAESINGTFVIDELSGYTILLTF